MSEANDSGLVRAALEGDSGAFEMLIDRYQKPLFNAAFRITNSREDALDATQSAFLKAYRKLRTFDPSRRFFSWIFKIVVNESLNLVQKNRRQVPVEVDPEPPATSRNPEQNVQASELGEQVQGALMELTDDHRVLVILRHFQGLTYQEMSEVVGVPEKTVKSRLFEARRRLRTILEDREVLS